MLRALDDFAAAIAAIEFRERFGILIGPVDQIGIALADWSVVHARHVIVAEAVYVILTQPVLVDLEKVVARKLLGVICSRPARKKLACKDTHHRIRFTGRVIDQAISELRVRMGIDGVEHHGKATLMTVVNEAFHPDYTAEAIIGREVSEWGVSPFHIFLDVGNRHQLQYIY